MYAFSQSPAFQKKVQPMLCLKLDQGVNAIRLRVLLSNESCYDDKVPVENVSSIRACAVFDSTLGLLAGEDLRWSTPVDQSYR
jgi:hypothetical protein